MKKKYFILLLITVIFITLIISLQIQVQEGNKGKAPASVSNNTTPKAGAPVPPLTIAENLKIVESILSGEFKIIPKTDTDYLGAIKTYKCYIPPGKEPLTPDYTPDYPAIRYTFSESATAIDGLIPVMVKEFLPTTSKVDKKKVSDPLVFYTAYIVKLQKNISAIVKSTDQNAKNSLLQKLQSSNFIYDDGIKKHSILLDKLILYVNMLLGSAFDSGQFNTKKQADFLCNYNTTNNTSTGILQKTIPPLLEDFIKIGFSSAPASLSVIALFAKDPTHQINPFIKA
jgi:hypothetical protein